MIIQRFLLIFGFLVLSCCSGCGRADSENIYVQAFNLFAKDVSEYLSKIVDVNPFDKDLSGLSENVVSEENLSALETSSNSIASLSENKETSDDIFSEMTDEEIRYNTSGMVRYAYSTLGESDRVLYREIYNVLVNHAENIRITSLNPDRVDKIFTQVMADHPEIFYVTGYTINKYTQNGQPLYLEFSGSYSKSRESVDNTEPMLEEAVLACISKAETYSTDYDKAKYLYEYIIENTEYVLNAEDNQNVLSVLLKHESVCQGYSKTLQLLLNRMGIPCILVSGHIKGGQAHAWNIAYIDGNWTVIDATWGDASYINPNGGFSFNKISYEYFCVSDTDLENTHIADNVFTLPKTHRIEK